MDIIVCFLWILGGLAAADIFTRMAFAVTARITKMPFFAATCWPGEILVAG